MSANNGTPMTHVDVLVLARSAVRPGMPNAEAGPVALIEKIEVPRSVHPLVAVYRYSLQFGEAGRKVRLAAHEHVAGSLSQMAWATVRDASAPSEHGRLIKAWECMDGWVEFDEGDFGEALNDTSDGDFIICAFPHISDAVLVDAANILAAVYGIGGVYDLRTVAKPFPRKKGRTNRAGMHAGDAPMSPGCTMVRLSPPSPC